MARVITFASSKGGTGKTVLVANVGVAMAGSGKKVVILDADIRMANLSLITGLQDKKTTLHEVLAGEAPVSSAVYSGPEGLKIMPCGISLNGIRRAKFENLKKVVRELSGTFEFLLVDSPSGLSSEAVMALTVAQELVIVVIPEITSLSNALKLKVIVSHLGIRPLGVVINRAAGNGLDIPKDEISSALELPVLGTIPEDETVRRSASFGESVITQSPRSSSAMEFKKLASAIVKAHRKI